MAHVSIYDTDITASAGTGDQNNGATPYPTPVKKGAELKLQPTQTDFAEYIGGSVYSEKEGELLIQVSFDYPRDHENEEKALEDANWVTLSQNLNNEEGGVIKVKSGESKSFVLFAAAPYFRLVWKQGGEDTKKLRIYARAQEKGRV